MKFEHLVQINDLTDKGTPNLSKQQLWDGLLCRAFEPEKFLIGLERSDIKKVSETHLKRKLDLPGVVVHDQVKVYEKRDEIIYTIEPNDTVEEGKLTMTIEEPEPESLFVRFSYCTKYRIGLGDELPYDDFVQQAYLLTDIDTIKIIRSFSFN